MQVALNRLAGRADALAKQVGGYEDDAALALGLAAIIAEARRLQDAIPSLPPRYKRDGKPYVI